VFVLVVGGGKVGYYLTRELIQSGHEVVLMEKDRARANQIADEIGSIVIPHDGCEGKYLAEAGANRAEIVAAVTGDDEDNLVICQMAKHHFDVPRTIARVNNPANEELFKHLGVDEIISPTRMVLGSIEQDIPVNELLHLATLGSGELELIEAHIASDSPALGRATKDLDIPEGCSLFAVIRDGHATPLGPETVLREGDKVIAIGQRECEEMLHAQLIGGTMGVPTRG
jgi:trk system potassium uptake protein TrkA